MRSAFLPALLFLSLVCGSQQTITELGLKPPVVQCTSVKDQFISSTCWSFAGNSMLESELLKKGKQVDLSEMFVARYSYLRKIHRHLSLGGSNFFTPGGQFHDIAWVMSNHGMMPEQAYSGKPNGALNHHHAELDTLLAQFCRKLVSQGIKLMSSAQEDYVNNILDRYLGKLPASFTYEGSVYTPFSFLERYLEINPADYVEITSRTDHPFYTSFILEDKYNWSGDAYYNVPLQDFSAITDYALSKGFTVGWDGDAVDQFFDHRSGLAFLNGSGNDQQSRQRAYIDGSTELNHMMEITGISYDKNNRAWYYVKNSWGDYSNDLGGYLFMRDDYFRMRTVAIIVNKLAIPPDIRARLGF